MVTFKANPKLLLQTLKHVKGAVHGKGARAQSITCEITVINGKAAFAVPGAVFSLPCVTEGTCKAAVPFLKFFDIIKTSNSSAIQIEITDGYLKAGIVTINANTTFFKDDLILRTIDLPINYSDGDLLRLTKENYTEEEFRFNRLTSEIQSAKDNLKVGIYGAYCNLKEFGVPQEEIEKLVESYLYKKTNK